MRVLKIIQANPDIFKIDQNKNSTELEAIKTVASMSCDGNEGQKKGFEIRQTHTAIYNLISLGFKNVAVDIAIELIPEAEKFQHYKIAQNLCETLIKHFYFEDNQKSARLYKTLYDKFTNLLAYEHESMLLCAKAIQNYKNLKPLEVGEIQILIEAVKIKLPHDNLWYHYYYYQYKSFLSSGKELEDTYLEAIKFFENLHFNHASFIHYFSNKLIQYYEENNELEKAKILIQKQNILLESNSNF